MDPDREDDELCQALLVSRFRAVAQTAMRAGVGREVLLDELELLDGPAVADPVVVPRRRRPRHLWLVSSRDK